MPCTGTDLVFNASNVLTVKGPRAGTWATLVPGCTQSTRNGLQINNQGMIFGDPPPMRTLLSTQWSAPIYYSLVTGSLVQLPIATPYSYKPTNMAGRWFVHGVAYLYNETQQSAGIIASIAPEILVNNVLFQPSLYLGNQGTRVRIGPPYSYNSSWGNVTYRETVALPFVTNPMAPGDTFTIQPSWQANYWTSTANPTPKITYGYSMVATAMAYRPTP